MIALPSIASLRLALDYNPETGEFRWKARTPDQFSAGKFSSDRLCSMWNARHAGRNALTAQSKGYLIGRFEGRMMHAHRVAWALSFGEWPPQQIDHINGDPTDNRISNLRGVDCLANNQNKGLQARNHSGVNGVSRRGSRWRARIGVDYKIHYLGQFETRAEAVEARLAAERKYGFHPNHGRPAPA